MFFLKKVWIKGKYEIIVFTIGLVALLVALFTRGKNKSVWKIFDEQKRTQEKELRILETSYQKLEKEKAEIDKKLEITLLEIEKKYEEENRSLDRKTKNEIKKIVKDTNLDPEELAKKLSEVTGLSLEE